MNALTVIPYAEFGIQSNFSFLRGASKPEELVVAAKLLGFSAIGLADRNTVAGVVRAWQQAKVEKLGGDHQFLRLGGAAQEGEIRLDAEFCIGNDGQRIHAKTPCRNQRGGTWEPP